MLIKELVKFVRNFCPAKIFILNFTKGLKLWREPDDFIGFDWGELAWIKPRLALPFRQLADRRP